MSNGKIVYHSCCKGESACSAHGIYRTGFMYNLIWSPCFVSIPPFKIIMLQKLCEADSECINHQKGDLLYIITSIGPEQIWICMQASKYVQMRKNNSIKTGSPSITTSYIGFQQCTYVCNAFGATISHFLSHRVKRSEICEWILCMTHGNVKFEVELFLRIKKFLTKL